MPESSGRRPGGFRMVVGGIVMKRILAALACSFLAFARAGAEPKPVVVARVSENAPYFWSENGVWKGLDVEIYAAIAKEAGVELKFERLPWSRAIDYMKTGECGIMSQLSKTPEREEYMTFLGPYDLEEIVLVVKKADAKIRIANLDELAAASVAAGKAIGIEEDAFYSDAFSERFANDERFRSRFEYVKTTANDMILGGRIFAAFDRRPIIAYDIRTKPQYKGLAVHPFVIGSGPVYIGVSKKTPPDVLARLEAACEKLAGNGGFKRIVDRWVTP